MIQISKQLELLGMVAEDKVTGFKGTIASVAFDLYGCVQALLNPRKGKDGKLADQIWFDVARLKILNGPVMDRPDFDFTKPLPDGHGPRKSR